MRRALPLCVTLSFLIASIAFCEYRVIVSTDHNDAVYNVNEVVYFSVAVVDNNSIPLEEGSISYKLTRNFGELISTGNISLSTEQKVISGKLKKSL